MQLIYNWQIENILKFWVEGGGGVLFIMINIPTVVSIKHVRMVAIIKLIRDWHVMGFSDNVQIS